MRHYVSKRSRRQPSVLVFLAQDADARAFCYADADLRKGEEPEAVFGFLDKFPLFLQLLDTLPSHAPTLVGGLRASTPRRCRAAFRAELVGWCAFQQHMNQEGTE